MASRPARYTDAISNGWCWNPEGEFGAETALRHAGKSHLDFPIFPSPSGPHPQLQLSKDLSSAPPHWVL